MWKGENNGGRHISHVFSYMWTLGVIIHISMHTNTYIYDLDPEGGPFEGRKKMNSGGRVKGG